MGVQLSKDSIDLGIICADGEAMLRFYRDVVGLEHVGDLALPGGGTMHRLRCGTSLVKLVLPGKPPSARAAGGGAYAATGYRYWTIPVTNLEEVVGTCEAAGAPVRVPVNEFRPGAFMAMVEDPDGNWVEFLKT